MQVRNEVVEELKGVGAVRRDLAGPHVVVADARDVRHPHQHGSHPVQILLCLQRDLELVKILNVLQGLCDLLDFPAAARRLGHVQLPHVLGHLLEILLQTLVLM